jgi:hypothetical protein
LSKGFLINLAISSLLGCVGGYFLSMTLMDSIWEQYMDANPAVFIYSILIIFAITLATIAGKIYAAAMQNPAECIRYE